MLIKNKYLITASAGVVFGLVTGFIFGKVLKSKPSKKIYGTLYIDNFEGVDRLLLELEEPISDISSGKVISFKVSNKNLLRK